MLTADLVRASVRKGRVVPRYLDVTSAELQSEVARLMQLFELKVGERVGELDEAIADHIGDSPQFMVQRGLVKLLKDRATIEVQAPRSPTEVREAVFRLAAAQWPVGERESMSSRDAVIEAAAAELELTVAQVEDALFADLKSEERLVELELPEPRTLLERYNLSLAQAVLLRARQLVVTLPKLSAKRARRIFRVIKFHQLMHTTTRGDDGWRIELDGPLSIFRHTQRYGLKLALLLPDLCLCEDWALQAEVMWGEPRRQLIFQVDSKAGLVTTRKDVGTWKSDEERHFEATFAKQKTPWKLRRSARVVDLKGKGTWVPDYSIEHPDGRKALLEIVWFWRKQSFKKRLGLLAQSGPDNLLIALATRLNVDERLPQLDEDRVYPFKGVIQPKRVIALAERFGTR